MMRQEVDDILNACGFFASIEPKARERLAAIAQRTVYPKGRIIFRQDETCPGIFVVGSGLVRVFKIAPNGKEHVLHLVGPGMLFAEVAAIGQFRCPAHAEAIEPTVCALLPAAPFNRALREDPELCLQVLRGMTFWVRHFLSLVEDIVLRDAAGRVARYLLDVPSRPDGTLTLPSLKKHLASHLNLTSETLSRTLRRLADQQMVEMLPRQRLRIADAESLREIAEGQSPRV